MKLNKLIYVLLFIAILGTTSVASAVTEETWNDVSFTVPDGYNTGTPSAEKVSMVSNGDRILLQYFDEDGLNELIEESELKSNETFNMNDLEINQLEFETESGTKYLFLFSKDDKDYQISYFQPAPADEEEDATDESADSEETSEESDDAQEDTFDINDAENPVNILINSLKF